VPAGYRAAWSDDRLNPRRAQGTPAGEAAMNLIWTTTVPKRLVDGRTGQDVTGRFPGLRYPFTSYADQAAAGVSTRGAPAAAAPVARPAPAAPPAAASGRVIQVGAFAVAGNANATAARLAALGLPVQVATVRQRGRAIRLVTAGPFAGTEALTAALARVRGAGFADAYVRN
jgi:cell division protein FtsN